MCGDMGQAPKGRKMFYRVNDQKTGFKARQENT